MKTRISTLGTVLLVTLALNLFAERIEKEVAEQIGKNYYWEASRDSKTLKYDEITLNLFTAKSENETPLYYIFNINSKDGFIIVAADDNVIPVLGYSFEGRWDGSELPPAFDQMLDVFENQIRIIIEEQIEGGEEVEALWEKYGMFNPNPEKSKSVSPLLTTTWNQNQYYNGMCPVDVNGPSGRAYAGCVAVSMAQVMKFWGHPSQGNGSWSYTHPIYGTLSANFGATTYSYNLMPNAIYAANTHIAQLLYHCGVSVSMNYGPYGSVPGGTYWDLDITNALKNYFKYSSTAAWDWKVNYNNSTWITKLKNELDNGRPLIYYGWDGVQNGNAHNFNCDGYRSSDNYFHFNWGWGGWYDGYFPITNLTPAQGYSYTYYQGAVFNLSPAQNPTVYYDFGDAPTNYPTLTANNGACHVVPAQPAVYLGYSVDTEPDGQPHINCTGDDTDILYPPANDDEDGVTFPAIVYRNTVNSITVIASSNGYLQGWIDYNQNSSWGDPGEQVFTNYPLLPGANVLLINIPANANTGWTYARFRFSTFQSLSYTGSALNGEVEDYFIRINEPTPQGFDFGDAPQSYQTLLANNGARHFLNPAVFLGNAIDIEPDGQPDPMAQGDDMNNTDDEDGVAVQVTLLAGPGGWIYVTASCSGFLNAWIDHEPNGTWAEPHDHVIIDRPVMPGINYIHMMIHPFAQVGPTYSRFRFSTMPGLPYMGPASDGEVEDYKMFIYPDYWNWIQTGKMHVHDIPLPVHPIINGVGINPGDLIGAFYLDENGNERCAGHVVWNGVNNLNFSICGDDLGIPGKEGFSDQEDIIWKIFSCNDLTTYTATATYDISYPNFDGKFHNNGYSALTSLKVVSSQTQSIAVPQGWGGVSSHLMPFDANIVNVCSGIQNDLTILQSMLGVYWPAMNVNSLVNWNPYEGYKIRVTSDVSLCITGAALTNRTLNLSAGWHIIPVLSSNNVSTASVLSSPSVVIAKEISGGKVYWPAMSIYTLNVLEAGKSYMVYLSSSATITFPSKGGEGLEPGKEELLNSPWNKVIRTGSTQVISISSVMADQFDEGDLIGAFNSAGLNVGLTSFSSEGNVLVIYGDDVYTAEVDGMMEGEVLQFKVYRQKVNEVVEIEPTFNTSMPNTGNYFVSDGISAVDLLTGIDEQTTVISFEIYPNPATDNLNIRFSNGNSVNYTVEIMNLLGEVVCSPVSANSPEVSINLSHLAEGCYLVRISNGIAQTTSKVIVQR